MNLNRPFLIAVTGGIASGKSLVCNWFEDQGLPVYYTDKLAHQILNEQPTKTKLVEIFGEDILKNGLIDREKLGKQVFDNAALLAKLNRIVHPQVRSTMQQLVDLSQAEHLVFEIPLLFENNLQNAFDISLHIYADEKEQLKRIAQRDGVSLKEAEKRIRAQMNSFDKQKLADINIANNGTIEELYEKLRSLWPLIRRMKKKNVKRLLEI